MEAYCGRTISRRSIFLCPLTSRLGLSRTSASIITADVNKDGVTELVTGHQSGWIGVWKLDGTAYVVA
jgi:hypothetical protein